MSTKVVITKVDDVAESPKTVSPPKPQPVGAKRTMKTFPKGVLKTLKHKLHLKPVHDPAKPPPLKKMMKKHTIRLMTDKGVRRHRKTLKKKIAGLSDQKVKELVVKNGLLKNPNTPTAILREMLEGGAVAGFISLE
jgi:hypothetical protein